MESSELDDGLASSRNIPIGKWPSSAKNRCEESGERPDQHARLLGVHSCRGSANTRATTGGKMPRLRLPPPDWRAISLPKENRGLRRLMLIKACIGYRFWRRAMIDFPHWKIAGLWREKEGRIALREIDPGGRAGLALSWRDHCGVQTAARRHCRKKAQEATADFGSDCASAHGRDAVSVATSEFFAPFPGPRDLRSKHPSEVPSSVV
jgi:hypothetical protein